MNYKYINFDLDVIKSIFKILLLVNILIIIRFVLNKYIIYILPIENTYRHVTILLITKVKLIVSFLICVCAYVCVCVCEKVNVCV